MHDPYIMHKLAMRTFTTLTTILTLASVASAATTETYQLEKTHADLLFSINHAGFTEKHGSFREFDATLYYDRSKRENSRITVTVQTRSLDTAFPARDEDVRGEAFLDVTRYPEMRFESTKVTLGGHGALRIDGSLTLRGITRPLTLQAHLNKEGPNAFDHRPTLGFSAMGSIRRSDFGMSKFLPLIGDIVSITIEVEFNRPAKDTE
jgi:polyisoprenoid-binding protein YceI